MSGKKGELRVVSSEAGHSEPDVVLFNEENPDGKRIEHPVSCSQSNCNVHLESIWTINDYDASRYG